MSTPTPTHLLLHLLNTGPTLHQGRRPHLMLLPLTPEVLSRIETARLASGLVDKDYNGAVRIPIPEGFELYERLQLLDGDIASDALVSVKDGRGQVLDRVLVDSSVLTMPCARDLETAQWGADEQDERDFFAFREWLLVQPGDFRLELHWDESSEDAFLYAMKMIEDPQAPLERMLQSVRADMVAAMKAGLDEAVEADSEEDAHETEANSARERG